MNTSTLRPVREFEIWKFLASSLGAFLVMYSLAFLFHVVIAADFIHTLFENVVKPESHHEDIGGIFLNYLIVAMTMAWIYPKGYAGGSPIIEGARFGLAIGLIVHLSAAFGLSATMDISFGGILGDKFWHVIETIGSGITIALIMDGQNRKQLL